MPSYISFTNKTTYPVISVYSDENLLSDNVLKNTTTKQYKVDSGTIEFIVKQNTHKKLHSVWLSLYPNKSYNLIIKNNTAYFEK